MSPPLIALYIGWSVWALLWIAAAGWSATTAKRPGDGKARVHTLLNLAGFAALLIVMPLRGFLLSPVWQFGEALQWAMVVLMAAGFALACRARLALGRLWSVRVERKEQHRLVDTGPYAVVRHPIYTGLIAAGLATALVKATPLAIAGCLLIAAGFTIKARREERFLAAEFGEQTYGDYRRRVPMLVPLLVSRAKLDAGPIAAGD